MTHMKQPMAVLTSQNSQEWYTPAWITDHVRATLGFIELDVASHNIPQTWIKAERFYTFDAPADIRQRYPDKPERDRMLLTLSRAQRDRTAPFWRAATAWLNPPFNDAPAWVKTLSDAVQAQRIAHAMCIVNSAHGYRWYEELWRAYPVCCLTDRVEFVQSVNGMLQTVGKAKKAQTIVLLSTSMDIVHRFHDIWQHYGRILYPASYNRWGT